MNERFLSLKDGAANLLGTKMEIVSALSRKPSDKDKKKYEEYRGEQEGISKKAKGKEAEAEEHFRRHVILARGLALFQVSIAIGAIAALSKRKLLWLCSLLFGGGGVLFLLQGVFLPH